MKAKPLVTISIVVWNGLEDTRECLKSLKDISYKNTEIILVDNGSRDGTVAYTKKNYPKVKILQNGENLGFTGGHNRAVLNAKGKYILLLNNDTVVVKDFLDSLVLDMENNSNYAAVQSKVYLKKNILDNIGSFLTYSGFLRHFGFRESDKSAYQYTQKIFSPKAASLLIRQSVIKKLGLFDDDYFAYFEETDWAWRVYLAGFEIYFEPKSIIYHKLGKTSSKLDPALINFHSFKNRLRTILKNTEFTTLIWMLPIHLFCINLLGLSFLIQGKPKIYLSIIRAQLWNLFNIAKTIKLRYKVQQLRRISDYELFKFALKPYGFKSGLKHYKLVRNNFK